MGSDSAFGEPTYAAMTAREKAAEALASRERCSDPECSVCVKRMAEALRDLLAEPEGQGTVKRRVCHGCSGDHDAHEWGVYPCNAAALAPASAQADTCPTRPHSWVYGSWLTPPEMVCAMCGARRAALSTPAMVEDPNRPGYCYCGRTLAWHAETVPDATPARDAVREAADGRNVYRLGLGPLGTIHCAVATSPDEPGVALVVHEVTPEESSEIDTGNHRFRGRETPSLRHVTEVWFQRTESVHAVIHALEDVLSALDARGGAA